MKLCKPLRDESGFLLPGVLSFIIAMTIFGTALLTVILNNFYVVGNNVTSQKAFNIAEGGLNYYMWRLSHYPSDYKDGQTTPTTPDPTLGYGPYEHDYTDANGKKLGTYTLWLKPQGNGSTIVNVRSIGKTTGSSITRTLDAKVGKASFASYGVVANIALWFGNNESANGPVHSNAGVRMDGASSDIVVSPNNTYTPPNGLGDNGTTAHPGVWCNATITTPVNCNTRDKSNWLIGTKPAVDFGQLQTSLCDMKTIAFSDDPATAALATQANRCVQVPNTRTNAYIPKRAAPPAFSAARGYLIQLNPNSTYDLYYVNAETDTATPYTSALTLVAVPGATGLALPSKGVIYVEDNVWIRSNDTFKGRVNIGAGRLDSVSNAEITIADDIKYTTKDGSDALGLVAEGDVNIAPYAPPAAGAFNFEIDAALLTSTGSVRYPAKYNSAPTRCTRGWVAANQTFTFYGSVGSFNTWTWNNASGSNCSGSPSDMVKDPVSSLWYSGIMNTDTRYDYHMQFAPPPSFPLVGGFQILSWREVLTRP